MKVPQRPAWLNKVSPAMQPFLRTPIPDELEVAVMLPEAGTSLTNLVVSEKTITVVHDGERLVGLVDPLKSYSYRVTMLEPWKGLYRDSCYVMFMARLALPPFCIFPPVVPEEPQDLGIQDIKHLSYNGLRRCLRELVLLHCIGRQIKDNEDFYRALTTTLCEQLTSIDALDNSRQAELRNLFLTERAVLRNALRSGSLNNKDYARQLGHLTRRTQEQSYDRHHQQSHLRMKLEEEHDLRLADLAAWFPEEAHWSDEWNKA